MKKYFNYIYIFSFCFSSFIFAQEVAEETAAQREINESIAGAKSKQIEAEKRIDEAQKEQEAAKTDQEKRDAELNTELARSDLYIAQVQQQEGLLDLAKQANNFDDAQKAQQAIDEAKSNQVEVQKKIEGLLQQLAREFVPTPFSDITSDSELLISAEQLQAGSFSDDDLAKKITYVTWLQTQVNNVFDDSAINDQLTSKKTTEDKLQFLDSKRMSLDSLLDIYRNELNTLETWLKSAKVSDKAENYRKFLKNEISLIAQKKAILDAQSVSLELQNVSLFSRIVSAVKDWFDSMFDFHKTPWYKRSVDYEISKLSDVKQQIDKLKFATRVSDIAGDIKDLETQFQEYKAGKSPLDIDQFKKNVARFQTELNALKTSDIQNVRNAVDVFNTLYKESLQPMTGDIAAKMRRYKNPQYVTLFNQLADYYASENIFGGLSYRPEQAYQALFTPEIIANLNAKNPDLHLTSAMFDPLTFNPDTISPELINQAYDESRTFYKQGTTAWQAARNAGFLLRNPVDKATYDAFLKDYKNLLSKGIKDPYKNRSPQDTLILNNEGAVSQLQITEATYNQLQDIAGDILITVAESKSAFDDVDRILPTLDLATLKGRIQTLQQGISDFEQGQGQQILSNN